MIQLDVAKAGAQLFNLSSLFNARVHDGFTPVKVQWINSTDGNKPLDVKGMRAFLKGRIGQGTIKDDHVELEPKSDLVSWEDDGSGSQPNGITLIKLPPQVFTRDGVFYGYIGLTDASGTVITSINIWFNVDQNVMTAGANVPYYLDEIQAALSAVQESTDTLQRAKQEIDSQIDLSHATFEPEAFENEAALKAKYPAGASGLMVTVDTGHKWLWINGVWKDCGIYQSAGDPERKDAHIGTAEQSSRVYDSLGDAIRDQAGQVTRAVKKSFEEWHAFPWKKADNSAYSKDVKQDTTSASSYYYNVTGAPLIRIKTKVEPYINFFTFLDINNQVLDYQRNDDKATTVDFVVAPPAGAITLVLGAEPGMTNSKDFVTCFDKGIEIGKFYQGDLTDDTFYIEHGLNRASFIIDSDHYDNLITADDGYQAWDDHLGKWVSQLLVPQGSGAKSVVVRKADDSDIMSTEMYDHFTFKQIPKSELHLKSYRNGLTDISDIFDLSYNNINQDDSKGPNYIIYNNDPTGRRISSQFVTVNHNSSWLIDLDDGYEVSFVTAVMNSNGQIMPHDFYNNANVIKTAVNWVGGHVYENLYTQGTYAVVFRKKDGSPISVNTIWDHVRIYEVDNTVHFPDYYRSHMQDRVDTINSKLTSPDEFGFGFITDVHAEFNTKHFPALIDEVRTKTPVNEFMGGGDWATSWFDSENDADNKPELFHFFEELQQLFKGVPLLKTVGNHEWAYGANNGYNITSQEMYAYYLRDEDKMFNDIQWGSDHTYYYWDDKLNHCRFISLNVMDYPSVLKPTGNQDNKEWWFEVGNDQINWLKATLNSVPDGYVVAIETHLVPLNANQFTSFPADQVGTTISNGDDLQAIASAYATKTGEFANAKGDLLAWFGGHYHADDITVVNHVTYVTTIADCMSVWDIKGAPQKTAGTVSEQAFDVATVDRANRKVNLIRIGDGSDRSFTY